LPVVQKHPDADVRRWPAQPSDISEGKAMELALAAADQQTVSTHGDCSR
jgi:hypothetical protein